MASSVATEHLFANHKVEMFDHDPDATTATVCKGGGYVDLRDFGQFAVMAMASALTGSGITKLEIVAAEDDQGTNVTVIKDSGDLAADAVGDYACLECSAEEIVQLGRAAGLALRYVAARITVQNAADEAVVTYIRSKPRFPQSGLTANHIAA